MIIFIKIILLIKTKFCFVLFCSVLLFNLFDSKNNVKVSLCHTNLLTDSKYKEYKEYFSELSFHKTLKNLISCGEYNKTKKRSTPMYCYGSTITCTRFPKFFDNGKPNILPRPYYSSKPDQSGYRIIRSSWFQSFLHDIENHVIHFLHNIVKDKVPWVP